MKFFIIGMIPCVVGACSTSVTAVENPREPDSVSPDYIFDAADALDVIILEYFESSWDEVAYVHELRERGYEDNWIMAAAWVARNSGVGLHRIVWEHESSRVELQTVLDRERVGVRRLFLNLVEGTVVPQSLSEAYRIYWARGYLTLSDDEIATLVQLRVLSDYFGSTPDDAVANVSDTVAFLASNYAISGAGGRTATGRMVEEGPRPWSSSTRSTWNTERHRVHLDR